MGGWDRIQGVAVFTCSCVFSSVAPRMVEAYAQFLEVTSDKGEVILSADDTQVAVGAEKLRVTGKSVQTAAQQTMSDTFKVIIRQKQNTFA